MVRRTVFVAAAFAGFLGVSCALAAKPKTPVAKGIVRSYYIAAEDVDWDYAPSGRDLMSGRPIPAPWTNKTVWRKTRYVEYTDDTFSVRKPQPEWLGILGPVIRAEVGDSIVVHFLNRTQRAHSIHPHGLHYDKDNEGARYVPGGMGSDVAPGGRFTYHWLADEGSGPGPGDPSSVVWWYHSHVDSGIEANAGLLGPIIVTAKGKGGADAVPKDVDREFITMFMIFDEAKGKDEGLFHTINGYFFGNLPGLTMNKGEKVRWYLLGMGNEKDLHTPHWHGETVTHWQRHTDVVELLPASMTSADMVADNPGTWMYHCHVLDHMEAGMMASFTIVAPLSRSCPLRLRPGDWWRRSEPSNLEVINTAGKSIRRLSLHAAYFVNTAQNLNGSPYEWSLTDEIQPGGKTTVNVADEHFQENPLAGYYEDSKVIGLAFFPGRIEYSDGTVWTLGEAGECFTLSWRNKDERPYLKVLPPLQPDEEEQEDQD